MLTEVVVASIVLVAVLSVLSQLTVRNGRLQAQTREYHLALEELSNAIARLTALEPQALDRELQDLTCSPATAIALTSPELSADVIDDAHGRRLTLALTWDRSGKREPVTLTAWLPTKEPSYEEAQGGNRQP